MLQTPSGPNATDKDSAVTAALKSASLLMQQRIIAQPKDMMGILFFGTEKSKFRKDEGSKSLYPNCYLHTDLDIPSAEVVRTLKELAEEGNDPDGILKPFKGPVPLTDMITCANQVFTQGAPNFGSRRLFIVTDNDDPCGGNKKAREQPATRAKDLFDLGVTVELFPITHEGRTFDVEKFYTDIIYLDPVQVADRDTAEEIQSVKPGDGHTLLNSMLSSIIAKQTPKRAYFSKMPFQLAPGMNISVNGYLILHRQAIQRSCYVFLENDAAPQIVKGETIKTEDGSMRTVEKTEIKKAYKFGTGGDFVYFTPQEMEQIRKFEPESKCLRIIGFKPREMLPPWATVKKSAFIFPTEATYVGSTRVFSALWQKLLDSNKMAIAWYIPRKNAVPQIVAILPSRKPTDENSGTNYLPAGLWLYPLPFVDDRRELEPLRSEPIKASDELIDRMRIIVQNLSLPKNKYDPAKYPNPALQHHYKVLQSMALDEDMNEIKQEDRTKPRYKQINKRVGAYQNEFKEKLDEEVEQAQMHIEFKRDAEEDADDRPKKRAKTTIAKKTSPIESTTLADLSFMVKKATLSKRTVPELKAICTEKGLSTSGKKADLLERIEEWVETQA